MGWPDEFKKHELGMMIGLHAGDSLGATLEFGPPSKHGEFLDDIVGGGHFNWEPGAATDDTDLAICVLENIVNNKTLNVIEFHEQLLKWGDSAPHDMGMTTRQALYNLRCGIFPSGISSERSQSNGSLMRCAAMALLDVETETLDDMVRVQCAITHAHPICVEADVIFVRSLREAFAGKEKVEIFQNALIQSKKTNPTLNAILERVPYLTWDTLKTSGYIGDTLASAYYGLLNCETFAQGVGNVANRGDDADTCAAVTGALCGAYYGLDSIPTKWVKVLKRREEIEKLLAKKWS